MGKMKQIAEIIANNDVHVLRRLIKVSQAANRNEVSFLGKTYSIDDANKILLYMYNEQAKYNKVRGAERALERIKNTDSKS